MAPCGVDVLENAIRQYVETKSGFGSPAQKIRVVERLFQEFDRDGSGRIEEDEFFAALVKMNIVGCREDALALFDKFDEDLNGWIAYPEFARALFANEIGGKIGVSQRLAGASATDASRGVVERVKARILELAGKNAGVRAVTRILRQMDDDGSNTLSAYELKEGLITYGVMTSGSEVATLMKYFDRDGSGRITIDEFLRGLRGNMSRHRRALVRMAWDQLVAHMQMDGPGDTLTLADFANFYIPSSPEVLDGLKSVEEALREFLQLWDKNGDDRVDWREFLDYYRDLSAGIEHDDYFELVMRNAFHLSGGSGWSENTSNIRCLVTYLTGEQEVVELKNDFGVARSVGKRELIAMLQRQGVTDISDVSMGRRE